MFSKVFLNNNSTNGTYKAICFYIGFYICFLLFDQLFYYTNDDLKVGVATKITQYIKYIV